MTEIEEILKDARFTQWTVDEQRALSKLMYNIAHGRANNHVIETTGNVWTTFIRILDMHLSGQAEA